MRNTSLCTGSGKAEFSSARVARVQRKTIAVVVNRNAITKGGDRVGPERARPQNKREIGPAHAYKKLKREKKTSKCPTMRADTCT